MAEKRRYPRYALQGMGVYVKTIMNHEVEIIDISLSGVSVASSKRFNIGGQYIFKFEHKTYVTSLKGTVVWEKLSGSEKISSNETRPIYTAGIEFAEAPRKIVMLQKFIEDHLGLLKEKKLSEVKVSLKDAKGILAGLKTCLVLDISLGGMKMELDHAPVIDDVLGTELGLAENEPPLQCEARVVYFHEHPEKTRSGFIVGMEFIAMSDDDKKRLEQFVDGLPEVNKS